MTPGGEGWRGPEHGLAVPENIRVSHPRSWGTYGIPRIQADLADEGERVSRQRIGRLMKAANLVPRCKRKFRVTTKASPN